MLDPTGLPVTGAGAVAKLRNPALKDPFFNEARLLLSKLARKSRNLNAREH